MNEKETGISYARLVEICTRLKDMLKEDYNADTIINHLDMEYDLDLDLNEINFIGFYEEDDISKHLKDAREIFVGKN